MDYSDSDRKVPATKKRPNTEPDLLHLPGTTESNNYTPRAHSHRSQECFPDFTTVEELVLSILNTKKGASDHMELLLKSGQLSNVVIFKAPRQIGGENSHVTDPENQRAAISSRRRIVIHADCGSTQQERKSGRKG